MQGSRRRTQHLRTGGAHGRSPRWSAVLAPLVPLAITACRGDAPRAEAIQEQGEETSAKPAEPDRSEEPPAATPPKTVHLSWPWLLTVQEEKGGRGLKITSMDIRSFAAPLLEPGDVILALDGRPVQSIEGLERYLHSCSPGEMLVLTVLRKQSTIHYAMLQLPEDGTEQAPPGQEGPQAPPGQEGTAEPSEPAGRR